MELLLSLITKTLIAFIRLYQHLINPIIGRNCRFELTCSQYGIEVLYKFGLIKGSFLIIKRVLKCHPLYKNKKDSVPPELFDIQEH